MDIKAIFEEEIIKIKCDENVLSIIVVGSSKNLNFEKKINDIDLFIITKEGNRQIREIKSVENVEFDLNYFSIEVAKQLIHNKELFFIEGMSFGNLIYDISKIGQNLIEKSKIEYEIGPKEMDFKDIQDLKNTFNDNIKRLRNLENEDSLELKFLTTIYLKDMIKSYFLINRKWIPKDKKILKVLKELNIELYNMIKELYENYNVDMLENIANYIFEDVQKKL